MIKIAAWEIDSISQFLRQLWRDPVKKLSPSDLVLTGTVLENGDFDNPYFSNSHLDFGILYNATFRNVRFRKVTLKDLFVRHVNLEGADFSGVTEFSGSRWEHTNWWRAKCVPEKMLDYLIRGDEACGAGNGSSQPGGELQLKDKEHELIISTQYSRDLVANLRRRNVVPFCWCWHFDTLALSG